MRVRNLGTEKEAPSHIGTFFLLPWYFQNVQIHLLTRILSASSIGPHGLIIFSVKLNSYYTRYAWVVLVPRLACSEWQEVLLQLVYLKVESNDFTELQTCKNSSTAIVPKITKRVSPFLLRILCAHGPAARLEGAFRLLKRCYKRRGSPGQLTRTGEKTQLSQKNFKNGGEDTSPLDPVFKRTLRSSARFLVFINDTAPLKMKELCTNLPV